MKLVKKFTLSAVKGLAPADMAVRIYLDTNTGEFSAGYNGKSLVSTTLADIEARVEGAHLKASRLKFKLALRFGHALEVQHLRVAFSKDGGLQQHVDIDPKECAVTPRRPGYASVSNFVGVVYSIEGAQKAARMERIYGLLKMAREAFEQECHQLTGGKLEYRPGRRVLLPASALADADPEVILSCILDRLESLVQSERHQAAPSTTEEQDMAALRSLPVLKRKPRRWAKKGRKAPGRRQVAVRG